MKVKLVVAKGKHAGQVIRVRGPHFIIGRHEECQLRVSNSTVSVHHCAILFRDDHIRVRDFCSTNGTFVNDEQVHDDRELHDGDHLRIGPLVVEVQIKHKAVIAAPAEKPASDSDVAAIVVNELEGDALTGLLFAEDDGAYGSTVCQLPIFPQAATAEEKKAESK